MLSRLRVSVRFRRIISPSTRAYKNRERKTRKVNDQRPQTDKICIAATCRVNSKIRYLPPLKETELFAREKLSSAAARCVRQNKRSIESADTIRQSDTPRCVHLNRGSNTHCTQRRGVPVNFEWPHAKRMMNIYEGNVPVSQTLTPRSLGQARS